MCAAMFKVQQKHFNAPHCIFCLHFCEFILHSIIIALKTLMCADLKHLKSSLRPDTHECASWTSVYSDVLQTLDRVRRADVKSIFDLISNSQHLKS